MRISSITLALAVTLCCVFFPHDGLCELLKNQSIKQPGYKTKLELTNLYKEKAPEPKLKQTASPETYIDTTVKFGLNKIIPKSVQKNLHYNVGYDRLEGLPTLQFDYFLPIRHWSDKSVFFAPRLSVTGSRESIGLGAGYRHMLSADAMVGFHVFHDWARSRRGAGDYLRQIGVGSELSLLPGRHSDLTLGINGYFPVNERFTLKNDSTAVVRESLPTGYDARMGFQLPALTNLFDVRIDGTAGRLTGDASTTSNYNTSLNIKARNGLWNVTAEYGKDNRFGENYKLEAGVNLTFDSIALLEGSNPFAAPYQASDMRFDRRVHSSLYQKVSRKYDLPTDRKEHKVTLFTEVEKETLYFSGGFPHLPNSLVTLQTSQSPWGDCLDVTTDDAGAYSGRIQLTPGIYKIRLLHKPTGRLSNPKTVVIEQPKSE